ncbi:MAG: LiaF domain-containing protein [Candidatus Zixiibacteriota bacterium]
MKTSRYLILALVLLLALGSATTFARTDNETKTIQVDKADQISINCELGAGEFTIRPKDMKEAAIVDITYDSRYVDYVVDYSEKGGRGFLDMESDHRRSSHVDTEDNIWDITLSTKYPLLLEMDFGACDADFDLGGLPIRELAIDIGAASGTIDFSSPNPERLNEIDIDAGATSLELRNFGNANFEYLNFEGGVGSFELDLRGQYKGESTVSVEVGLGSVEIVMPEGVAFRIETDGDHFLSSIDFHNSRSNEVDDNVYESDDFEDADTRIILELSAGLGSIDVYWK